MTADLLWDLRAGSQASTPSVGTVYGYARNERQCARTVEPLLLVLV